MSKKKNKKDGKPDRPFDLEHPELPGGYKDLAFRSGNYPYKKKLDWDDYEEDLRKLQIELVKVQRWARETGARIVLVFEGRDAAGKGGTIRSFRENMNPRAARIVALSKPTEVERGQWYFQRYIAHMPTDGEIVLFDRSWYNRAGVEKVMGFCKPEETEAFLAEVPHFEAMLAKDGILVIKFWLNIGQEMQLKRFHDRRHNPLKIWKLSPIDIAALDKWDDYTEARNKMLSVTHSDAAPWVTVRSNDKRRARLNAIRYLLSRLDYDGKDPDVIGEIDPKILSVGGRLLLDGAD